MKNGSPVAGIGLVLLIVLQLALAGCLPGAKEPYVVRYFVLDYAPVAAQNAVPLAVTLKVERFSALQTFNTQSMLYREKPFSIAAYHQYRWMANPGDLVSDFLLRDTRAAGFFQAVYSYRDGVSARFVLEGGVEEFLEIDEAHGPRAALTVVATLRDTKAREAARTVLFQRKYVKREPMDQKTAEALAQAMSSGMAKISAEVLRDTHEAVQGRLRENTL